MSSKFKGNEQDEKDVQSSASKANCDRRSGEAGKGKRKGLKRQKSGKRSRLEDSKGIPAYNDVSWWFQDAAMARDAASIWFTQRVGEDIPGETFNAFKDNVGVTSTVHVWPTRTQGIMRVNFVPTYGVTGEITSDGFSAYDTSAINTALNRLYWDIVHANSRNISYEASDLGRLFIMMDNVFMMLTDAARAYGLAKKYSTINPYYGRILLSACGWDYDSLINNIADFRYKVNVLINLVNKIHVPKVFNIFAAHSNMCNRVFADGNTERAQLYVTVPNGYYSYNDSNGEITWNSFDTAGEDGKLHKYVKDVTYLQIIQDRIQEILNSQYMGVMDGDILKRYGAEMMFSVPELSEDHETLIVEDLEFELMLSNANFVALPSVRSLTQGYAKNGVWVMMKPAPVNTSQIQIEMGVSVTADSASTMQIDKRVNPRLLQNIQILNLPDGVDASPETVMLSTRMMCSMDKFEGISTTHSTGAQITSVGTMLGEYCTIYELHNSGELKTYNTIWTSSISSVNASEDSSWEAIVPIIRASHQFRFVPRVVMCRNGSNDYWDISPVDNFAYVSRETINKLNYVAITSIFTEVNAQEYGWAHRS